MKKFLLYFILVVAALTATVSCDLMHDDMPPCDTGCYLSFKYDYNIPDSDYFSRMVGCITVFVYDSAGNYVTKQQECNEGPGASPLAQPGYTMHLDLQPGTYHLLAYANQKRTASCWEDKGPAFRWDEPKYGDAMSGLHATLDRGSDNHVDNSVALDTLWSALHCKEIVIKDLEATHDTLPLMRLTKHITVNIHYASNGTRASAKDHTVGISADDGMLGYDGTPLETERVIYQPNDTTAENDDKGNAEVSYSFSTSRLMLYDDDGKTSSCGPRLRIVDAQTGKTMVQEALAPILAKGNEAYAAKGWGDQEYLDRQHEYVVDFYLSGDTWSYAEVRVNILGWTKRIQNMQW